MHLVIIIADIQPKSLCRRAAAFLSRVLRRSDTVAQFNTSWLSEKLNKADLPLLAFLPTCHLTVSAIFECEDMRKFREAPAFCIAQYMGNLHHFRGSDPIWLFTQITLLLCTQFPALGLEQSCCSRRAEYQNHLNGYLKTFTAEGERERVCTGGSMFPLCVLVMGARGEAHTNGVGCQPPQLTHPC